MDIKNSKITINNYKITAVNSTIKGDNNIVTGNNNTIKGSDLKVYGNNNTIKGSVKEVIGNNNTVKGKVGSMIGNNNTCKGKVEISADNVNDLFEAFDFGFGDDKYGGCNTMEEHNKPKPPRSQMINEGSKPKPPSPPSPRVVKELGLLENFLWYLNIFMCYLKFIVCMGHMSRKELKKEIKEIKKSFGVLDKRDNFDRSVFFDDKFRKASSKKKSDPSMNYPGYEGGYIFFLWYKMLEEGKREIAESIENYIKENDLVIDLELMDEAPLLHEKIK